MQLTIRDMVEQAQAGGLQANANQVRYILKSRGIAPLRQIGRTWLYRPEAVSEVVAVLRLRRQLRKQMAGGCRADDAEPVSAPRDTLATPTNSTFTPQPIPSSQVLDGRQ